MLNLIDIISTASIPWPETISAARRFAFGDGIGFLIVSSQRGIGDEADQDTRLQMLISVLNAGGQEINKRENVGVVLTAMHKRAGECKILASGLAVVVLENQINIAHSGLAWAYLDENVLVPPQIVAGNQSQLLTMALGASNFGVAETSVKLSVEKLFIGAGVTRDSLGAVWGDPPAHAGLWTTEGGAAAVIGLTAPPDGSAPNAKPAKAQRT